MGQCLKKTEITGFQDGSSVVPDNIFLCGRRRVKQLLSVERVSERVEQGIDCFSYHTYTIIDRCFLQISYSKILVVNGMYQNIQIMGVFLLTFVFLYERGSN